MCTIHNIHVIFHVVILCLCTFCLIPYVFCDARCNTVVEYNLNFILKSNEKNSILAHVFSLTKALGAPSLSLLEALTALPQTL